MVERTDLLRATGLYQQSQEIKRSLDVMDRKGTITAVTITVPSPEDVRDPDAATVSTIGLQYPPQMIEAIRTQLEARLHAIDDELASLGVSGGPERGA